MPGRACLGLVTVPVLVAASITAGISLRSSTPASASLLSPDAVSTSEATFTVTPCLTGKVPDSYHGSGCATPTATPTSQHPYGCGTPTPGPTTPTNTPGGPTATSTPTGTACPVPTATPCPTDTAPSFPPGGCGTFTPIPTSVRLPPMLTIDFTVNGAHDHIMTIQGQLMSIQTAYRNIDNRGITIDDTVDLTNGGGHGAGHCYISPGSSCSEAGGFSANDFGTMTATLRLIAQVEGCGFCPTLEKEHSIVIDVIARGDFNCDGSINSIDAALILQLSAALIQPFGCTGAGDANRDGYTNAIDSALVLQYVAGLISGL